MAFAIACILWLAAFAAAGLSAVSQGPSAGAMAGMALQDPLNQRLVDTVGLLPGNQWRHGVEQGRRLAKERDGHLYQMLLAWFQHDIRGLLCGLLLVLPLVYVRQLPGYFGYLHRRLLLCRHLQYRFCHGD
ncbi:hypothetical protein ACK4A2_10830 [Aeromonas veronii]